jgi:deoxycytidylate deaminase
MTAQFLTEVLPFTSHDPALRARTGEALEATVTMLTRAQDADGSWNSKGGWAGVLQSAMANNALEMAAEAGVKVDDEALQRSRQYQKSNVDAATGRVETGSAAGISLYALASNQRATAKEAREAEAAVSKGVRTGALPSQAVTTESLKSVGYADADAVRLADAYQRNQASAALVQQDEVLAGFGNNGGEEFLSYMMTSESLVETDQQGWGAWREKMQSLFAKIQNQDGSWSGHHCITSPVFCTAAVIMALTADRMS